ncbi:hypothetical protein [Mucilaginibacter sp. BT774]|uniref:hypothetical protein n=1 Tax=Mucilaginibacter sp. BT774 TaxID=3062276 RepID=UPI002676C2B9|nr:hypothetical protein [Mucilaginibacter sp. BT774]
MMNKNIKKLILIIVISTGALFTWAMTYRHLQQPLQTMRHQVTDGKKKEHNYDPALLRQLEQLAAQLDFNKQQCTYSGIINVDDGGDTTASVHNLEFLFSRSGKDFYYRMGNTETIHEDGVNLFIQHEQNKIVLSHNDMVVQSPVTNLATIEKNLRYEDYDLVGANEGGGKKISLLNNTHITCKELSMTYDTISGKLQKLYTRFSDIADPLNKEKDRVISVSIKGIEDNSHLGHYPRLHDVITATDGNRHLKNKYANYELILL